MAGDERAPRTGETHSRRKTSAPALKSISRAAEDGIDLRQIDREVVSYLRELLLLKSGLDKDSGLTSEEMAELKTLSGTTSLEQIVRAIKLFGQIESTLDNDSTLPMELALVDACTEPVHRKTRRPEPRSSRERRRIRHSLLRDRRQARPHRQSLPDPLLQSTTQNPTAPNVATPRPVARVTEPAPPKETAKISALEGAGSPPGSAQEPTGRSSSSRCRMPSNARRRWPCSEAPASNPSP